MSKRRKPSCTHSDTWSGLAGSWLSAGLDPLNTLLNIGQKLANLPLDIAGSIVSGYSLPPDKDSHTSTLAWTPEFLKPLRYSPVLFRIYREEWDSLANEQNLDNRNGKCVTEALRQKFIANEIPLSAQAIVEMKLRQYWWQIRNGPETYAILLDLNFNLRVYAYPLAFDALANQAVLKHMNTMPRYGLPDSERQAFGLSATEIQASERLKHFSLCIRYLHGQGKQVAPLNMDEPSLRDYFEQTASLPEWADTAQIRKAQAVFELYKFPYMIVLICASLPRTYACWRGAQILHKTGRLALTARPVTSKKEELPILARRVVVTAQFVLNVLSPGGLHPDGTGIRTVQVLRLLHTGVRVIFEGTLPEDELPVSRWGDPIDHEDLAMTLMAFSIGVIDGLKKLNIHLKSDEEEALLHTWKVVGHFLGIRPDVLTQIEDMDSGMDLWDSICNTQHHWEEGAPNEEERNACIELTDALIEYIHMILGGSVPRQFHEYLIRYFIGDDLADQLQVPQTNTFEPQLITNIGCVGWGITQILNNNSLLFKDAFRKTSTEIYAEIFEKWSDNRPVVFFQHPATSTRDPEQDIPPTTPPPTKPDNDSASQQEPSKTGEGGP